MWAGEQLQFQLIWAGDQLQLVSYSKELLNSFRSFNRMIVITELGNYMERKKWNIIIYDCDRYTHGVNSQTLEHIAILEWSSIIRSLTSERLFVIGLSTRKRENSGNHPQIDREVYDGVLSLDFSWWWCWAPKVTPWLHYW
jgi:hypothetical protein